MKTLFGTFVFVALAVITIVTLSSGCRKQDSEEVLTDKKFKFTLKIGRTDDDFVDVKSQDEFDEALCALKANGHFNVGFKKGPNATPVLKGVSILTRLQRPEQREPSRLKSRRLMILMLCTAFTRIVQRT
jgi:hypothetical protein